MKILLVDDHLHNRVLLRRQLEKLGQRHDYLEAVNGEDALLKYVTAPDIDLILMDVMMPVMDGVEATKAIKARAGAHHVAIIFITALDDQVTLDRCLQCGGDDFITKPVNPVILNAKLLAHQRVIDLQRSLETNNLLLRTSQALIESDHQVVEKMFQQAMSRNVLNLPGFQYYLSPLSMFNGDLLLVTEHPEQGIYLLVGDFTGHGLSAAMGSLPMSEIFFAMTRKGLPIGAIAAEMHSRLRELLPVSMFCCAALLNVDKQRRRLNAWIGGMDSFFIVSHAGQLRQEISTSHLPLGVHWGDAFDPSIMQLPLQHGDRIFCFTDGVTEATNHQGEMFGKERLRELLTSHRTVHVATLIEHIQAFCGSASQRDDITITELICETPIVSLAARHPGINQPGQLYLDNYH